MNLGKIMIEQGADIDAIDETGWTPLIYTMYNGNGINHLQTRINF